MKAHLLLFLIPLLLCSCLKDDLDPATLTTNPLDPDYTGTPLVVMDYDTVRVIMDFEGDPIDTVLEQKVRVRTDLLSPLTGWSWIVNGEPAPDGMNNDPEYTSTVHHVVIGSTHCFQYTLLVQFSATKPYSYCSVAAW